MIIRERELLILAEIFIQTDVKARILEIRAMIIVFPASHLVIVFPAAALVSHAGNEVPERSVLRRAGIIKAVNMVGIRPGREIDLAVGLQCPLFCDNVDDAARRVRAIFRRPRPFDDLDGLHIVNAGDLIKIGQRLRPVRRLGTHEPADGVIHPSPVQADDDAIVTVDGHRRIILRPRAVFPAVIPDAVHLHPRQCLDGAGHIGVVPLRDILAGDDVDVAARAVIGLLGDDIAEFVLHPIGLDDHRIQRVLIQLVILRRRHDATGGAN